MIEDYNVRAVLAELKGALKRSAPQVKVIPSYVEKTGLSEEEQVEVLQTLGKGTVTIDCETDQPDLARKPVSSKIWVGTLRMRAMTEFCIPLKSPIILN